MPRERCSESSWSGHGGAIMTPSPRLRPPRSPGWMAPARLILHDPEQAKDAVQETLVRAWRDMRALRDPDRFDAWVHRLLVNSCLNEAKRLRRHRFDVALNPLEGPSAPDGTSALADRDELDRGFRRLAPD